MPDIGKFIHQISAKLNNLFRATWGVPLTTHGSGRYGRAKAGGEA